MTKINKIYSNIKIGKFNEAIECYNVTIQFDPTNAEAWFKSGKIYKKFEKSYEAFYCFNQAILLDPDLIKDYSEFL